MGTRVIGFILMTDPNLAEKGLLVGLKYHKEVSPRELLFEPLAHNLLNFFTSINIYTC